jgi:hypothetical protein
MKSGKLLLSIALVSLMFASCKRDETLGYTCLCKSSTGGSTFKEVHNLYTETREEAKELCESFAKPPSDMRNTCTLELE